MKSRTIYLGLLLLVVAAGALAASPIFETWGRAVMAVPAAVALVGIAIQLFRDQLAFDRQLAVAASQESFSLGAASHMATVAFDKHVEFAEKYVEATHLCLSTLSKEGPSESALAHADNLSAIRRRWILWITPSISAELQKFEQAVRIIGAKSHFVATAVNHPGRHEAINQLFQVFEEVVGGLLSKEDERANHAILAVISRLRVVLGVAELTELRLTLVASALQNRRL